MFDFEPGKLIIIGIVALIVIGPKDFPRVMRQLGQAVAKLRRMAAEFRGQFMEAMRDAEIEDMKADVGKLAESAKISASLDPLAEIKAGITSALEAADKPAALPVPPVIAAPGDADASLNSIALPRPPEAPASSAGTFLAEGVTPAVPEPESGPVSGSKAPAVATEAEMQALADALKAEIAQSARAGTPKTQDKVSLFRAPSFGYIKSMIKSMFRKS